MSYKFPETIALIAKLQQSYEDEMRARGKPIPRYSDTDDGAPPVMEVSTVREAKPRKEGVLRTTSKAEIAREIMRTTRDQGLPLDAVVQMIMEATGHDKALAKATYKANAARVGIVL